MTQLKSSRATANERALERIGFRASTWNQMNWFVEFSKKNIEALSDEEFHFLQQEIAAVVWEARRFWLRALPSREELGRLQAVVAEHLNDLGEWENTEYGPVTSVYKITKGQIDDEDEKGNVTMQYFTSYSVDIQGPEEQVLKNHLIILMFELLRDHAWSLSLCPHCSQVFLKFREHAKYCSRECQSVATMRARREKERELNKHQERRKHGTDRR